LDAATEGSVAERPQTHRTIPGALHRPLQRLQFRAAAYLLL
jgi:hypothetical protein